METQGWALFVVTERLSHLGIHQSQPAVFRPGDGDMPHPPDQFENTYFQVSQQQGILHSMCLRVQTCGLQYRRPSLQSLDYSVEQVSYSRYGQEKRKEKENQACTFTQNKYVLGSCFVPGRLTRPRPELTMDRAWKGIPEEGTASASTYV